LALSRLFEICDPQQLRGFINELIGEDELKLLEEYGVTSAEQVAQYAGKRVLDQEAELLNNSESRKALVQMLPSVKLEELARKVGISDNQDMATRIAALDNADAILKVKSFFGAKEESIESAHFAAAAEQDVGYGLFAHQRVTVAEVKRKLYELPRKLILHMPTGAGKTRTAMHILSDHLREHEPTLVCWLAQGSVILEQAAQEFQRAWECHGNRKVEVSRFWGTAEKGVTDIVDGVLFGGLAKMRALKQADTRKLISLADRVSLVIVDEAHQAVAPTYEPIISLLSEKKVNTCLLGLTATPGRSWWNMNDDRKLADYFEKRKVVMGAGEYGNPVRFLIQERYLAEPKFTSLATEVVSAASEDQEDDGDVSREYLKDAGEDTARNRIIIEKVKDLASRHKRIIVFAPSVDCARQLMAVSSAIGYESHVVTARTKKEARGRIVERFQRRTVGKPMILYNYDVLTTGFDAPKISAAVIARPTYSLVLYSQMIGRAMRGEKAGGNETAEIATIVDRNLPGFEDMARAFENWEDVWNQKQ